MAPVITPVTTSHVMPDATTVVIIGGGIVGLTAALTLAERNIPVVVLEKGRIAGNSRHEIWAGSVKLAARWMIFRWRRQPIACGQRWQRVWAMM
ncbi:FAD-dependent oxidoreductase [Pantoea sp. LMR881]|uniref:FAD-dependent oxidoreductase n=1 Tax=Pantoea sp. LMR881 TaxID=3014336 RepID=UPI0022AEE157|nr:FAD-dependent oxidoreductase [Pantoea sp. LMR881]MCZ4060933.1 FAD-dependent oxidoreductase [Pantoea sp. LMR881]